MKNLIDNLNKNLKIMRENPNIVRIIFEYKCIGFCSIFNVKNSHYEVEIWKHPEMTTIEKFNIPYTNYERIEEIST